MTHVSKTTTLSSGPPDKGTATPVNIPEIMPAVRIRQATPFGNMHVKIVVDPNTDRELEVFAQLGKAGDMVNSDLEAMCRLLSLFLRVNGSLNEGVDQLHSIGSTLIMTTKEGDVSSLPDGLSKAIRKYQQAKKRHGLRNLLIGNTNDSSLAGNEE